MDTEYKAEVEKDAQEATELNINGTPTFVLVRSAQGKLDDVRIVGATVCLDAIGHRRFAEGKESEWRSGRFSQSTICPALPTAGRTGHSQLFCIG